MKGKKSRGGTKKFVSRLSVAVTIVWCRRRRQNTVRIGVDVVRALWISNSTILRTAPVVCSASASAIAFIAFGLSLDSLLVTFLFLLAELRVFMAHSNIC